MKIIITLFGIGCFTYVQAQNVGIGTPTPQARLHIKGNADTSQLLIDAHSTQGNLRPLIRLRKSDGSDLLWIHSDDSSNIFIGKNAGRVNNRAGGGINNTFIGSGAGFFNTTGISNTANGIYSLRSNSTGNYNTAQGVQALYSNSTGAGNTANGYDALYSNLVGYANTAMGMYSLRGNANGYGNTANGYQALYSNIFGYSNTAIGYQALYNNTHGDENVAIGDQAGLTSAFSSFCTYLGYHADNTSGNTYDYSTALGTLARITGSGLVRIGNSATASIGGYTAWSTISDGRFKNNITESVKGLDFILNLRPVTYHLDVNKLSEYLGENIEENKSKNDSKSIDLFQKAKSKASEILHTGFIAQEVEAAAKKIGYDFSGVDIPKNENDLYALRYAEFVVPLVKAVQEQQTIIEQQQNKITDQEKRLSALEKLLNK
ncbi:MAG: tail fiber domain-containing protein [Ferruginibacter sp.]